MESVLRAAMVYVVLLLLIRIAGRRTLAQMTNFDFILLLIISEGIQNAMIGEDYSMVNGVLVVMTLIFIDVSLSLVKRRWPALERWLDGVPTILVDKGRPLPDRMIAARVSEDDILAAAREQQGIGRMADINYAVLEVSGGISIIPKASQ